MDRKQALCWLIFSMFGFALLILTGEQAVAKESEELYNFGTLEIGALGLLIGTWVFLTGSNPERNKLKTELKKLNIMLSNRELQEALALWPFIESLALRTLAERDPLYTTYQSLRYQVASSDSDGFETCKQSFSWLRKHFKRTQNWKQLIHFSLLYGELLESESREDEAHELLEELSELSEKFSFTSEVLETKLAHLQNKLNIS